MKKIIIASLALLALIACNSNGSKEEKPAADTTTNTGASTDDLSSNPEYQEGLELIAKSDCLTCHKVDEAFTGPTYRQVADKYSSASDTIVSHLARQIIKGSTGVWGQTPMIPHPQISQGDAEKMVKYILLLKK